MEPTDKIMLTLIMIEDDGRLAECATIKHEGKLWLVPQWLDIPSEQVTMPERIICLEGLGYQVGGPLGQKKFDYTLNVPVPTAVLYGPSPQESAARFHVVLHPAIKFRRLTGGLH